MQFAVNGCSGNQKLTVKAEKSASSAENFYLEGFIKLDKEQYDAAIVDFDKALKLNPNYVMAYYRRGDAWLNKAITDFKRVLELDPDNFFTKLELFRIYLDRGNVFYINKDYDRAISDFSKAIKINPKSYDAYVHRGSALNDKRDYDRAISDFSEAIKINPNFFKAYFGRGKAWFFAKNYDRAISDFNKAIEIDQTQAIAYYFCGLSWQNKKDYDRAIQFLDKTIEIVKIKYLRLRSSFIQKPD